MSKNQKALTSGHQSTWETGFKSKKYLVYTYYWHLANGWMETVPKTYISEIQLTGDVDKKSLHLQGKIDEICRIVRWMLQYWRMVVKFQPEEPGSKELPDR